jgi:hypothetical protein
LPVRALDELAAGGADTALPLHRLEEEAGGVLVDGGLRGGEIVELDDGEAGKQGREAVAKLRLVGGADRRHRSAVKGVAEGDEDVLPGPAMVVMVAARRLDRALHRLGARIGEEDGVGEGEIDQPLGKRFALGRAVEVGDVYQGPRLLLDRPGQMRVAVAEQVDRDSAREVEIFLALLAVEIDPLPAHRPHRGARINGHERRDGHGGGLRLNERRAAPKSRPSSREGPGAASTRRPGPLEGYQRRSRRSS